VDNLVNISEAASVGLHAMALLAARAERRWTNQDTAEVLAASVHHVAKVMQRLVRAGLVDSAAGPGGGFRLARAAGRIKLLEVYEAIEGPLGEPECLLSRRICPGKDCLLGEMIHGVDEAIRGFLTKTTLVSLAERITFLKTLPAVGADRNGA
jgi:Rrf2 family protein